MIHALVCHSVVHLLLKVLLSCFFWAEICFWLKELTVVYWRLAWWYDLLRKNIKEGVRHIAVWFNVLGALFRILTFWFKILGQERVEIVSLDTSFRLKWLFKNLYFFKLENFEVLNFVFFYRINLKKFLELFHILHLKIRLLNFMILNLRFFHIFKN